MQSHNLMVFNPLVNSLYEAHEENFLPPTPPTSDFMITEDGTDYMITESSDHMITE